jgi:hypothetical protein
MTLNFEPCTNKLSTVEGVYVIAQSGKVIAVASSFDHLKECIEHVTYCEAYKLRISLCSLTDGDADDITHLIFWDMFHPDSRFEYRSYEDWAEDHGRNGFVEFWADEWGRVENEDVKRRKALIGDRPVAALSKPAQASVAA